MARIRSLVTRVEVDTARRAHHCQANGRHRVERGDKRLRVTKNRSVDHYCLSCAKTIVERDIAKLTALSRELSADHSAREDASEGHGRDSSKP